jgi:hypothetical protein
MPINCKVQSPHPEMVIFVHCHGSMNSKDLAKFTEFLDGHLNGEHAFKLFFDLRKAAPPAPKIINGMTKYMIQADHVAQTKIVASSILVGSSIIENLLKTLFSIQEPTTPTKVTASLETACEFLNDFDWYIERMTLSDSTIDSDRVYEQVQDVVESTHA